jgi:hypothetical protein
MGFGVASHGGAGFGLRCVAQRHGDDCSAQIAPIRRIAPFAANGDIPFDFSAAAWTLVRTASEALWPCGYRELVPGVWVPDLGVFAPPPPTAPLDLGDVVVQARAHWDLTGIWNCL